MRARHLCNVFTFHSAYVLCALTSHLWFCMPQEWSYKSRKRLNRREWASQRLSVCLVCRWNSAANEWFMCVWQAAFSPVQTLRLLTSHTHYVGKLGFGLELLIFIVSWCVRGHVCSWWIHLRCLTAICSFINFRERKREEEKLILIEMSVTWATNQTSRNNFVLSVVTINFNLWGELWVMQTCTWEKALFSPLTSASG